MTQLKHLEEAMKAQFIWDKSGNKRLQVDEEVEGSKDLARMVFVGIADMNGFDASHVMEYLDMEYESHRHKLTQFKKHFKEALRRNNEGTISLTDDTTKKVFYKTSLSLNSIRYKFRVNPYLKLEQWMQYE